MYGAFFSYVMWVCTGDPRGRPYGASGRLFSLSAAPGLSGWAR